MSPSVLAPETAAKSQTAEPDGWTGQERQDVVRLAFMIQWGGGLVAWCNRAYAWGKNDAGRSTS